jgi:hypothetical protein
MLEFKVMSVISLVIIFISVFFVHFAFNSFIRIVELCSMDALPYCSDSSVYMIFIFSFAIVVSFVIVIESTVYFIFKQVEVNVVAGVTTESKMKSSQKDLEQRREEIKNAKKDARREYLNRKIEESTYNGLKEKYDKELFELETKMGKFKKKVI